MVNELLGIQYNIAKANVTDRKVQNLASYINVNSLRAIHKTMDKNKASGIDKVTKEEYEQNLEENLEELIKRMWSYVKKKYKLNVTNFPFFVIVNSLSLLRPFPSFSDIVPHIHLETNIHNDYEYGLYYRMFQYIQKLVYMHECS